MHNPFRPGIEYTDHSFAGNGMTSVKTYQRRNITVVLFGICFVAGLLITRVICLMIYASEHYALAAQELHERERPIKAERGKIFDRNGIVLADNMPVCTISVIYSQITNPEQVIRVLCNELQLSEEYVRKRVEKYSSMERIKTNVEKEIADRIRAYEMDGVMVDEDYRRYYPFSSLASKVIGFTGSDNQGIVGLEVTYDRWLRGDDGKILTLTTAHGIELPNEAELRVEPIKGNDITTSLDVVIQCYAEQAAGKVLEAKQAKQVSLILMNPQNGEVYAMVNVPEYDLNHPYRLYAEDGKEPYGADTEKEERTRLLNRMWRNSCISDTYEPGSAFKIITAAAALEHQVISLNTKFYCPGYKLVEDRRIHCHKLGGHGSQTFVEAIKNSCNPAFMEIGAKVGIEGMYDTFRKLGLFSKTGIDLPGEAGSIMHQTQKVGAVELATISFGQSFQITPLQLLCAVSTVINGGKQITPHIVTQIINREGTVIKSVRNGTGEKVISGETSDIMKELLEKVVSEGTGKRAYLPGMRVGGKTATSEKLPRSSNTYIASFVGFAPAEHPEIVAMVWIDEPQGIYYGGTVAAPVIAEVFDMVLPYLGIEPVMEK